MRENPVLAERFLNNHFVSLVPLEGPLLSSTCDITVILVGRSRAADHKNEEFNKQARKYAKKGKLSQQKLERAAVLSTVMESFGETFHFSLDENEADRKQQENGRRAEALADLLKKDLRFGEPSITPLDISSAVPYPLMMSKLSLALTGYKDSY